MEHNFLQAIDNQLQAIAISQYNSNIYRCISMVTDTFPWFRRISMVTDGFPWLLMSSYGYLLVSKVTCISIVADRLPWLLTLFHVHQHISMVTCAFPWLPTHFTRLQTHLHGYRWVSMVTDTYPGDRLISTVTDLFPSYQYSCMTHNRNFIF